MNDIVLVYPHQLFAEHPALSAGRRVYLIEDPLFFSQYRFHAQKLILHRASMKAYEERLRGSGHDVRYIEHGQALDDEWLQREIEDSGASAIHAADVVDDWLHRKIVRAVGATHASLCWHETPQFLCTDADVRTYWGTGKKHLQHTFYVWQRKRLGVLFQDGKPAGGSWSFDAENRKRLPKSISIPAMYVSEESSYVREAARYVEAHFSHHYGTPHSFSYAVTHEAARDRMAQFMRDRFAGFGAYEDAIATAHHELFHSVLSPYLNNGLLTPREVLDAALSYAEHNTVPIASLEGFVRQLIGWREFVRMVYVCDGARMRTCNELRATHRMTEAWWRGDTGIAPVDHTIATLQQSAYTHHIIRLMVMGNIMTLLGIHPDECYRWFMEWYIDAYDWVMVPNVYGMALFADGGSMTTKPYVSSSNYLKKMSDYPKGSWEECWDALYWVFVHRHRAVLTDTHRASFAVIMYDRFTDEKKAALHTAADRYATALRI